LQLAVGSIDAAVALVLLPQAPLDTLMTTLQRTVTHQV
jgi:hypothetical protein